MNNFYVKILLFNADDLLPEANHQCSAGALNSDSSVGWRFHRASKKIQIKQTCSPSFRCRAGNGTAGGYHGNRPRRTTADTFNKSEGLMKVNSDLTSGRNDLLTFFQDVRVDEAVTLRV